MEIKDFVVTEPKNDWTFSFQWLIDLFTRIFNDVFGFIAGNEGWVDAE